jgi:hypothetical protein
VQEFATMYHELRKRGTSGGYPIGQREDET